VTTEKIRRIKHEIEIIFKGHFKNSEGPKRDAHEVRGQLRGPGPLYWETEVQFTTWTGGPAWPWRG